MPRYDLDTVSSITGCPKDKLEAAYALYASTGAPDKVGTILYAMGQTQHTVGSQNVRAMAMLQLLLGNIGRPGGGVNALRGESNVQGSTDMGLLAHLLTAYLPVTTSGRPRPGYLPGQQDQSGRRLVGRLLDQRAQVFHQPAQGVVGRARHRRTMALPTTICPRSKAPPTTTGFPSSRPCTPARSRACGSWARTRRSPAPTPAWSARRCTSWTGW